MALDGSIFRPITEVVSGYADIVSAVLEQATDVTLVLTDGGMIKAVTVNPYSSIGNEPGEWIGQGINSVVTRESQDKLETLLRDLPKSRRALSAPIPPVELNHIFDDGRELPIRYTMAYLEADRAILMMGRDLTAISTAQQTLIKTQAALENDTREQRERNAFFSMLKTITTDPVLFVSQSSGRIADMTNAASKIFGEPNENMIGKKLATFVPSLNDAAKEAAVLSAAAEAGGFHGVTLSTGVNTNLATSVYRTARDTIVLCRLDASDQTQSDWHSLAISVPDALAIVESNGTIVAANSAFVALADQSSLDALIGKPITEQFDRGQVDWNVVKSSIDDMGLVRHYQTEFKTHYGAKIPISIAATQISEMGEKRYGLAIRELSSDVSSDSNAIQDPDSVAELVGKTSLKEIVSQTTEIIEKICIETAIKMTKNNRFAAAEMLNLSRQSLYVKLRKYGLIDKTDAG